MEYQVPQFIEVEDKIFGPLTLKQFIFLAGGIGLCVVLLLYLPLLLGIILAIPVAALTGALAFYRVNNKSFTDILGAGFAYYTKDRLYLWRKEDKETSVARAAPAAALPEREKLGLSSSKLKDLALELDIKDRNVPQEPL
ncbi:MAG: PrgI family protein [Patescibacteria group bacterium]